MAQALSDVIPVSAEALRWLRLLARARDEDRDGWDESKPYSTWEELLALGVVEHRPSAFRLSDIGWWMLSRVVTEGTSDDS